QILPFGSLGDGDVTLGAGGGKFSFAAGAELTPIEGLHFGLDYRHKADINLTGDAHAGHIPATFQNILRDQAVSHALTWPNILQAGAAYQLTPDLLVNVGYIFVRWIVYKEDLFVGETLNVRVPHNYHNGFGFTVGAEYKLPVLNGLM